MAIRKQYLLGILMALWVAGSVMAVSAKDVDDYLAKAGDQFKQGDYSHAAKLYRKAVKADAKNPYGSLGLAMALKEQRKYSEARDVLQRLIQTNPQFTPAYYNLGLVLEAEGNAAKAKDMYRQYVMHCQGQVPPSPTVRIKLRKLGLL